MLVAAAGYHESEYRSKSYGTKLSRSLVGTVQCTYREQQLDLLTYYDKGKMSCQIRNILFIYLHQSLPYKESAEESKQNIEVGVRVTAFLQKHRYSSNIIVDLQLIYVVSCNVFLLVDSIRVTAQIVDTADDYSITLGWLYTFPPCYL